MPVSCKFLKNKKSNKKIDNMKVHFNNINFLWTENIKFLIHTFICPDSLLNGPTYEDLASSSICVIFLTPGLSSCWLIPDKSAHLFFQYSISSRGPAFSAVSKLSWELSTSLICLVQWIIAAGKIYNNYYYTLLSTSYTFIYKLKIYNNYYYTLLSTSYTLYKLTIIKATICYHNLINHKLN